MSAKDVACQATALQEKSAMMIQAFQRDSSAQELILLCSCILSAKVISLISPTEMYGVVPIGQHHVINALVTPLVPIKDNPGAMVIVIGRIINAQEKVIISISQIICYLICCQLGSKVTASIACNIIFFCPDY